MQQTDVCQVDDQSQVAEARRRAVTLGEGNGLDPDSAGRLAIVTTELATNLLKHAGSGQLLLRALRSPEGTPGVEVLSIDKGPGIPNLAQSMRDGYSTSGTPGQGLGAVRRLSRTFDLYSREGQGTAVTADVWKKPPAKRPGLQIEVGVVNAALHGEPQCGDSWDLLQQDGSTTILVIDGLGHGGLAAEAAAQGVQAFRAGAGRTAGEHLLALHAALRPTRGAAAAVAVVDHARGKVTYCGIGNISGVIQGDQAQRHMVSHNGILGHEAKVRTEFTYPWDPGCTLIMTSDGIATRWSLDPYPGLARRHPSLIAGMIYRDFARGRDDTTVLAMRGVAP